MLALALLVAPQVSLAWGKIMYGQTDTTSTAMVGDDLGGFWVAWSRNDTSISVQHMDENGNKTLPESGETVIRADGEQKNPVIASLGVVSVKGALVAWQDERNGNDDIYAQSFTETRSKRWSEDFAVAKVAGAQSNPIMVSSESQTNVIVWQDERNGDKDIYGQRILAMSAAPSIEWDENGGVIVEGEGDQTLVDAVYGEDGSIYVSYLDDEMLKIQKMTIDGEQEFGAEGKSISTSTAVASSHIAFDMENEVLYVAWTDMRGDADGDVYVQKMSPGGSKLWGVGGKEIAGGASAQTSPKVLPYLGGVSVVWQDARLSAKPNIYYQHVESDGDLAVKKDGVALTNQSTATDEYPILLPTRDEHMLLVWTRQESSGIEAGHFIMTEEFTRGGAVLTPASRQELYSFTNPRKGSVKVAPDRGTGYHVTYVDNLGGLYDFMSTQVHPSGAKEVTDYTTRVTASGPGRQTQIKSYDVAGTSVTPATITPYGAFTGGANVAVGDVTGDGEDDIVVGPRMGGGPHVRVYSKSGEHLGDIWPYPADSRMGVQVAVGNVDSDAAEEIVLVPEAKGRARVKVYNFDAGRTIIAEWDAFGVVESGGSVAVGDVDKDGVGEVIVGAGPGGGPHVRVFEPDGTLKPISFFAYHTNYKGGIDVAAADVDGDGKAEIATVPKTEIARVKIYRYNTEQTILGEWKAYGDLEVGGRVDLADIDNDGKAEVVTGVMSGGPHVRSFEINGTPLLTNFFAFENTFRGGVDVSVGSF